MKTRCTCWLVSSGVFLCVLAIISLFVFLMRGNTTISGNYPENVKDNSIICNSDNFDYPFFRYDNSLEKNAKISILFNDDSFKSISLVYTLFYNNEIGAKTSETQNHAAMNINFGESGLGGDSFSAHYNINGNKMTMNIYATSSDLQAMHGNKYFLIDNLPLESSIEQYKKHLEKQGFACEININNKRK